MTKHKTPFAHTEDLGFYPGISQRCKSILLAIWKVISIWRPRQHFRHRARVLTILASPKREYRKFQGPSLEIRRRRFHERCAQQGPLRRIDRRGRSSGKRAHKFVLDPPSPLALSSPSLIGSQPSIDGSMPPWHPSLILDLDSDAGEKLGTGGQDWPWSPKSATSDQVNQARRARATIGPEWSKSEDNLAYHRKNYKRMRRRHEQGLDPEFARVPGAPLWNPAWSREDFDREHLRVAMLLSRINRRVEEKVWFWVSQFPSKRVPSTSQPGGIVA